MGILDGSILEVDDFFQCYKLTVFVNQYEAGKDEPEFKIVADPSQLQPKEAKDEKMGMSFLLFLQSL